MFFLLLSSCADDYETDYFESNSPEEQEGSSLDSCTGIVSTNGGNLNIRTSPEITDNVCAQLENETPVIIALEQNEEDFFKIKTTQCSDFKDEWVYASSKFIDLNADCFETEDEESNEEEEADPVRDPDSTPVLKPITNISNYIYTNLERTATSRPLTRNSASGPVEVFKLPGSNKKSICGSKHIRSHRSAPHMAKDTFCAWTSITQEWRKSECIDGSKNCRIMLGDASFGNKQPSSWPHSTHRRGWCMDIWPMRKKGCGEKEVTWKDSCYDRKATAKFVDLLIENGADVGNQLFFNDPKIPRLRKLRNHDDHIHVCFKPSNSIVKSSCDDLTVDRKVCPEF